MLKGFTHARLACGCRVAFREGVEGSPVTIVVDQKSPGCPLIAARAGLPALRLPRVHASVDAPRSPRGRRIRRRRMSGVGHAAERSPGSWVSVIGLLARPDLGAPGLLRPVRVAAGRPVGGDALRAGHRPDAGVPPLLRAPRLQDGPRHPVRLGADRHVGDAEGAAVVGGAPRHPPQVRRPRRRSAQPARQRLLLRAHRLVHRATSATTRSSRPIRSSATSASSRSCGCSNEHYWAPPAALRSACISTAACSGWRGASCCRR